MPHHQPDSRPPAGQPDTHPSVTNRHRTERCAGRNTAVNQEPPDPNASPACLAPARIPAPPTRAEQPASGPPPIPVPLAAAPTYRGLVVPVTTAKHTNGRPVFGVLDGPTVRRCLTDQLCATCGQPLQERVVILARVQDLRRGLIIEPGSHPHCHTYARRACPMIAGATPTYHRNPDDRRRCADAACWCHHEPADDTPRAGSPADRWVEIWLNLADYRTTLHGQNANQVGVILDEQVIHAATRIRSISPPHVPGPPDPAREPLLAALRAAVTMTLLTNDPHAPTDPQAVVDQALAYQDQLLAGGPGTAEIFNHLTNAIAAAAHTDAGITILGMHFCTRPHPDCPQHPIETN